MGALGNILAWAGAAGYANEFGDTIDGQRAQLQITTWQAIALANRSSLADYFKKTLTSIGSQRLQGVPAFLSIYQQIVTEITVGTETESRINSSQVMQGAGPLREHRFYVTGANMSQRERFSIHPTFGSDPDFLQTFGEEPRVWSIGGIVRSGEGENQWDQRLVEMYNTQLRASVLIEQGRFVRFHVGTIEMDGYLLQLDLSSDSQLDDALRRFQMSMYVRKFRYLGLVSATGFTDIKEDLESTGGPDVAG